MFGSESFQEICIKVSSFAKMYTIWKNGPLSFFEAIKVATSVTTFSLVVRTWEKASLVLIFFDLLAIKPDFTTSCLKGHLQVAICAFLQ